MTAYGILPGNPQQFWLLVNILDTVKTKFARSLVVDNGIVVVVSF
jgi:hypothetical protein